MTDKKTSPNYRVPALEKGLEVLEVLANTAEPLSLSQISDMTGKTTSELFRTLNCLVDNDYVSREDVSGKYLLTLKLFELAHRHSPLDHLLQAATVPMQELARKLKESCHISIIRRNRLLVLAQANSPNKVRISVSVGATFSAANTVSGRLLLSVMPDDAIESILVEDRDYAEMSPAEREIFWQRLQTTRETGISTASDETFIGLQDTATLIGNPDLGITAALAVTQLTASKKRGDTQRIIEGLVECARTINQRAGLSGQSIVPSESFTE